MDDNVELSPAKIRIGLAIVTLMFLATAVLTVIAEGAIAKSLFFAVGLVTLVRAGLLVRWLRAGRGGVAAA